MLSHLLPLTNIEPRRFVFTPTDSQWVAYFDNSILGTDASPVMAHMARLLKCRAVRVSAVPQDREALRERGQRSHSNIFELFEDHDTDWLNLGRSIALANDGGWVFRVGASEQPFETPEVYSSRKVLDRFPLPLLDQYLRALNIRAF